MSNPLLTSFDKAPFEQIKNEHFKPAFLEAIENARKEIDTIAENTEKPTFENTLGIVDFPGKQLHRV